MNKHLSPVFQKRDYYKPFCHPWAFEAYHVQQKSHWLPEEISLAKDIENWKQLSPNDQNLITQVLKFFTTGDIDVAAAYCEKYLPMFKKPEIRQMLTSFAGMEGIHVHAYSTFNDELGFEEKEYMAFLEYQEMVNKHDYIFSKYFDIPDQGTTEEDAKKFTEAVAKNIAVYSAFTEGMQLFSSFAILFNFSRHENPMNGLAKIVEFSIKDENLHVEGMMALFKTVMQENPWLAKTNIDKELITVCETMVNLEDKFIDLSFEMGDPKGLQSKDVKQYIRYIANMRMTQLGLPTIYNGVDKNPLPWMSWLIEGEDHTNFFENRSASYAKANWSGTWGDVWGNS